MLARRLHSVCGNLNIVLESYFFLVLLNILFFRRLFSLLEHRLQWTLVLWRLALCEQLEPVLLFIAQEFVVFNSVICAQSRPTSTERLFSVSRTSAALTTRPLQSFLSVCERVMYCLCLPLPSSHSFLSLSFEPPRSFESR